MDIFPSLFFIKHTISPPQSPFPLCYVCICSVLRVTSLRSLVTDKCVGHFIHHSSWYSYEGIRKFSWKGWMEVWKNKWPLSLFIPLLSFPLPFMWVLIENFQIYFYVKGQHCAYQSFPSGANGSAADRNKLVHCCLVQRRRFESPPLEDANRLANTTYTYSYMMETIQLCLSSLFDPTKICCPWPDHSFCCCCHFFQIKANLLCTRQAQNVRCLSHNLRRSHHNSWTEELSMRPKNYCTDKS